MPGSFEKFGESLVYSPESSVLSLGGAYISHLSREALEKFVVEPGIIWWSKPVLVFCLSKAEEKLKICVNSSFAIFLQLFVLTVVQKYNHIIVNVEINFTFLW